MTTAPKPGHGPLSGVRVVELAGIGPGPFAAMLLADLGADVVQVSRPGGAALAIDPEYDITNRNKRSVVVDLKAPDGPARVLDLAARADILVEGNRPGVAERLGVGPEDCHARNPALVYGRMTGWGQDGPLAQRAGHDIAYIALTGTLGMIGEPGRPPAAPANLLGDYAGGALYLVVGVLAALHHARATGTGQVVDAAIVDGTSHLAAMLHGMTAAGGWQDRRGAIAGSPRSPPDSPTRSPACRRTASVPPAWKPSTWPPPRCVRAWRTWSWRVVWSHVPGADGLRRRRLVQRPMTNLAVNFVPQGIGADLIATIEGFSRRDVDEYAALSQERAATAWKEGRFDRSVVPVKDRAGLTVLDHDEHLRPGTTADSLREAQAVLRGHRRPGRLRRRGAPEVPLGRELRPRPPRGQLHRHRGRRLARRDRLQGGRRALRPASPRADRLRGRLRLRAHHHAHRTRRSS